MDKLEWSLPEYQQKERSRDWYLALGVIVVCGAITSVIYSNYFFATLLVLGGLLLGYFSMKKPEVVYHELNSKGLIVRDRLYLYDTIKSFSIEVGRKPQLIIHSERVLMPIITMPIEEEMAQDIHDIFTSVGVPEENITPHTSETIMDSLGF